MYFCRECGRPISKPGIGDDCAAKLGLTVEKETVSYKYARESEFSNLGEDIPDSARHRRHEWKDLESAETSGEVVARNNIARDKLLKNSPPAINVNNENIIASTVAVTIMKRMPAEPNYYKASSLDCPIFALCKKGRNGNDIIITINESESRLLILVKNRPGAYVIELGKTTAQADVKIRQAFFEKYEWIKKSSEDFAKKESLKNIHLNTDPKAYSALLTKELSNFVESFDDEYGIKINENYTLMSGDDSDFSNRYLQISGKPKKYSVSDMVIKTQKTINEGKLDESINALEKAIGGASISIGTEKGSKGVRFNPIVFYSQELKRVGPEIAFKTKEEMEAAISREGGWNLRAAQWGESVSDKERKDHLKNACESLSDLQDALGLSNEMISFGGKLGIAFGARGRGNALAHFEPGHNVINLTRKNGIGALAHEFGHALEHNLYDMKKSGGLAGSLGFIPKDLSKSFRDTERNNSRENIDQSFAQNQEKFTTHLKVFYERMCKSESFKAMPVNHKKCLKDPAEIFARTFEAMVKRKLEKKSRTNTYLVSCEGESIYPNDQELEAMEPYFDFILKSLSSK